MDRDSLLQSLAGTLDANPHTRKESEQQLHRFETQPGFTAYLLDLVVDKSVPLGTQILAAIFFKNRVANYWAEPAEGRPANAAAIQSFEKAAIKQKLVETLIATYRQPQVKIQLTTAVQKILSAEKWLELLGAVKTLIADEANADHVYAGLLCLYEYTKCYRWTALETGAGNPVYEDITTEIFPVLEPLVTFLVADESESLANDEMLYLIVKIFKYITYLVLPSYFDAAKLGSWCQLLVMIINKPLPLLAMQELPEAREQHPRVKAVKWCFGDLHRLLSRHGGGHATADKSGAFATTFMAQFVPQILGVYWSIIEKWSAHSVWLLQPSLYHLILFLEQLIDTPAWALLEDKLEAIVKHVLLPSLRASQEAIELYDDDPEEYIRRYFDVNRDSITADVAAINFIYRLAATRFKQTATMLLTVIDDIMKRRAQKFDLQTATEAEGALRILSTLQNRLDKKSLPVAGKIDDILHTFVYPELLEATIKLTPWLTARACDTIAMFVHHYHNQQYLQDIFEGVVRCFQTNNHLPIQITAVDALRTLVDEDSVAEHIADQAPQLMGTLLEMSKTFESDILTSVMDAFVKKFAKNLEPYALQLASGLSLQFMSMAMELLEQQGPSNNINVEKEYQAAGILNTLSTLVIAMNSSPHVAALLEPVFQDMVKFVLENAMVLFLPEVVEILESDVFSTEQMSPIMWDLYQACIDLFETYALEYFDTFQPFFESVINHGFSSETETIESPHVQSLISVCFLVLKADEVDPVFADSAFELIGMAVLSMRARFVPFLPRFLPEIFEVFQHLEAQDAFDGYMLHHLLVLKVFFGALYIEPDFTLEFLQSKNFVTPFFQLWFKHSDSFQSVYGCKLQILANLGILCDSTKLGIVGQLLDTLRELADLLISNLEALPHAIRARQEILTKESSSREFNAGEGDDDDADDEYAYTGADDFEADEAELEALKQTPIDGVHVFEVFSQKVLALQGDAEKYKAIFGDLDANQIDIVTKVIQISQQQLQQQQQQQQQQG